MGTTQAASPSTSIDKAPHGTGVQGRPGRTGLVVHALGLVVLLVTLLLAYGMGGA